MPHVRRRMLVMLDAPEAEVRAAARDALGALVDDGDDERRLRAAAARVPDARVHLRITPVAGGPTEIEIVGTSDFAVPFFGWALRPLVRAQLRRAVAHAGEALRAAVEGRPAPPAPRAVVGLPDAVFDAGQSALLATAAAATALAAFGGALYGQNAPFVADSFGVSDAGLGAALAATRAGVLVSLLATALADRHGRRRLVIVGAVGVCLMNAVSAVAPTFETFTAFQVLNRGFVNTTAVVAAIAAVEEAPEGARAFAAAMLGLAGGFGFAFAVLALPLADLGEETWRVSFALSGLSIVFVPRIARHLREGRRFHAVVGSGIERGRLREVFTGAYGRRFLLLGLVGFLTNVFNSPSAQLTNRFLADERSFSAFDITVFRAVTSGLPGVFGVLLAGRLAETRGRRPVAVVALLIATSTQMVFFLSDGPLLWLSATVSIVAAASAGLAIATLDAELFPTEVRGTSNALLLVIAVAGSATGLLLAGGLSDPVGGLGPAIALCGIGALVAAVVLVPRLPESLGRRLDDVSPHAAAPD